MFERPTLDTTERVFRKVWEMACYAGFPTGRERSVARGTFGSPSFYVGDELFGKDRLREVEEEIEAQKEVRR
jgi:2-hydroxychromene-2-carboxylate isomerase